MAQLLLSSSMRAAGRRFTTRQEVAGHAAAQRLAPLSARLSLGLLELGLLAGEILELAGTRQPDAVAGATRDGAAVTAVRHALDELLGGGALDLGRAQSAAAKTEDDGIAGGDGGEVGDDGAGHGDSLPAPRGALKFAA